MMALKYKEGTSTANHVSEFQSVMNQLLGMGVKFDDEILGLWLLATLPNSWDTFRVSLINYAPHGIIKLVLAKSDVLNEEGRNRENDGKGRDKSQSKSRSIYKNLECHHFGKKCHIKKYYFKLKRENKGGGHKNDQNDDEKSESVATVTREDLLVICDQNLFNLAFDETSWVIDNGASIHVTSRGNFFTSYTPGDFGVLKMGNDGLASVTCMGDVSLFQSSVERETGKKLKSIRTDNGSEYRDVKLPSSFWAESLNIVTHVINMPPSVPLRGDVPEKVCYRLYDPIQKKFVRSRDVVIIKDQTIDYIDKTEKKDSLDSGDLTNVNLVPLDPSLNPVQDDGHGDVNDDQQDVGNFDAPIDDVVTDQQQAPIAPPVVPFRRSSRD
ncbi:hypothetical protein V6N11_019147 [Hibiscus sabdariffa]|uniref:Retrovirus-related Pol polyprotein from transposon TNT 1-94-like beta-barrel domain-containing protein n=1 Tax=Hibiscus sabdariffa TaxID=183260 RepID=A0ABR2R248_9ROSI